MIGKVAKERGNAATTSKIMSAVRSKDSRAETMLRSALHQRGIRFRLHASDVLGCPDVVIRKFRFALFVDGDFWHGNSWRIRGYDSLAAQFAGRREFWVRKINKNIERDVYVAAKLKESGWTVLRLWESEVLANPDSACLRVVACLAEAKAAREKTALMRRAK